MRYEQEKVVILRFMLALFVLVHGAQGGPAYAYTEADIQQVFSRLDVNADGKVTREEYNSQKIFAIYRNVPVDNDPLTGGDVSFGQTRVSREFFDATDSDRNGKLSPVELARALDFDRVVTDGKGYFTRDELGRFMKGIGR